jgi:hypothetical protein
MRVTLRVWSPLPDTFAWVITVTYSINVRRDDRLLRKKVSGASSTSYFLVKTTRKRQRMIQKNIRTNRRSKKPFVRLLDIVGCCKINHDKVLSSSLAKKKNHGKGREIVAGGLTSTQSKMMVIISGVKVSDNWSRMVDNRDRRLVALSTDVAASRTKRLIASLK